MQVTVKVKCSDSIQEICGTGLFHYEVNGEKRTGNILPSAAASNKFRNLCDTEKVYQCNKKT